MGDLSQAEIDALLGGGGGDILEDEGIEGIAPASGAQSDTGEVLSDNQKDILGEIGNISMGTAATTLFALLNQKVLITTPVVTILTWQALADQYERPCVGIRVNYKEGLRGANILVLRHEDVKIIANLMMGGDGVIDKDEELTELDLSAIGEAMNQMVGSSSTSLSSMTKMKIDIDTPQAFVMDFGKDDFFEQITGFEPSETIVSTSFRMEIGTLIDSSIMQILPKDFAIDMVESLCADMMSAEEAPAPAPPAAPAPQAAAPMPEATPQPAPMPQAAAPMPMPQAPPQQPYPQPMYDPSVYQQPYPQPQYVPPPQNVSVAQFQSFDASSVMQQKENIGIIMDVPLEVTVELGRTRKKIKEILEFSPGSIIELDKLAGEPIDILVNGKFVAKGEVVVIDENFGIRITDIIGVEERI